jgi:hypothetical protein
MKIPFRSGTAVSKHRLAMGAWFLAALLVAASNAYMWVVLESRPLVAHSQTIKSLGWKLARLEEAGRAKSLPSVMAEPRLILARYVPQPTLEPAEAPSSAAPQAQPAPEPETLRLPSLSGAVQVAEPGGRRHYRVVLDGRICSQGDRIGDFTVARITGEGVVLSRHRQEWFLPNPVPLFNTDQGD